MLKLMYGKRGLKNPQKPKKKHKPSQKGMILMNIKAFAYNGQTITQRQDGYINLTQMCQVNGKKLDNFMKTTKTQDYVTALSNSMQMEVVDTKQGQNGGTWGHPSLAINLARWISAEFAVWCDAHIFNLMTSGKTSLDIDPLEEMRLKIEYEKLKGQNLQSEFALTQFRHTIVTTCPEPVQQKVLGYQTVKEVERVEVVIDKNSGQECDGVGITYIAKSLGFKTTQQCWAWLERVGYGKDSNKWQNELTAIHTPKLSRNDLQYLKDIFADSRQEQQLFLGEN